MGDIVGKHTRSYLKSAQILNPLHHGPSLLDKTGTTIAQIPRWDGESAKEMEANARRLAAAWNECAGISTEALESRAVEELLAALKGLHAAIQQWRESGKPNLSLITAKQDAAEEAIAKAVG